VKINVSDVSLLLKALDFAAEKHRDQRRKGGEASPYINHLIDTARLLWRIGKVRDITVMAAAILHDTVEDTETTVELLETEFGGEIAGIVLEVTDDKTLPNDARKRLQVEHAPGLSHRARLVKIADKISNITDILESPPAGWTRKRRLDYIEWAEAVVNRIRGTNLPLERYFDELCARVRDELGER